MIPGRFDINYLQMSGDWRVSDLLTDVAMEPESQRGHNETGEGVKAAPE